MAELRSRRFCPTCDKFVGSIANGPNHVLHLILTLVTFFCWTPIWLLVSISNKRWHCSECASLTQRNPPRGLEMRRAAEAQPRPEKISCAWCCAEMDANEKSCPACHYDVSATPV